MTVVAGIQLHNGHTYICSDAAVGYGDGYRRLMSQGKWWAYDGFFIGESGTDFALSRVRAEFERRHAPPSAELLAECVRKVTQDLSTAGNSAARGFRSDGSLECELLYADPDGLFVCGGDGGILGPYDFTCVGHGALPLTAYLTDKLPPPSKRTYRAVNQIVRRGMRLTAQLCDSVCGPFFDAVTD